FSKMPLVGTNQPQSLLHMNIDDNQSVWLQLSNALGTGQLSTDGIRLGVVGSANAAQNGSAYLYNQENKHLLFSTNATTASVNLTVGATNERMRITSIGAPTVIFGTLLYGTYNPAGIANLNTTRTSISHNPAAPIVRPMSLMHLGYGANVNSAGTLTDGWRPWMDIGTYTSSQFDNMYVGLKPEGTGATTYDAVINWGRNKDSIPNSGPDHLRFIFTGNYAGGSVNADESDELNGAEMGRFFPGRDTTGLASGSVVTYGRFGVGDFTAAGLNQEPTHKLDVDGNARLRLLPDTLYMADTTVKKVVMVDESGVLRWGNAGNFIGHYCSDTVNLNPLADDYEIPMDNHNYHFDDNSSHLQTNNVGIGTDCATPLLGKLQVRNLAMQYGVLVNTITDSLTDNYGVYANAQNAFNNSVGVYSQAVHPVGVDNFGVFGLADSATQVNYGGKFRAGNNLGGTADNFGVYSEGRGAVGQNVGVYGQGDALAGPGTAVGGQFLGGTSNVSNKGVAGNANFATATGLNYGGDFNARGSGIQNIAVSGSTVFGSPSASNYGGAFRAIGGALNYAVYGQVSAPTGTGSGTPAGPNYAGYFLGDVFISGIYGPSDQNMKDNIDSISNADSILALLKPKYFDYKQTGQWQYLNLSQQRQTGLLAQDVEAILPSFVKENTCPDQYDTSGTVVVQPSFSFKTIDYDKFIPLLIAGYQSQDAKIDSLEKANDDLDSVISALQAANTGLNDRLTTLENCVNALDLCDGQSLLPTNNAISVELTDAQSIVLDQNVPNPFAEQTTITYALPTGVQKAQMLFYNADGRLINSVDLDNKQGKGQL
ncbi:MAG TPA: tail fiber domain-containing protein, partial [Flavobacteriales bacterium]|nr:tail fiber domain-containing protein [Flavobacteriales bacterium]